GATITLALAGGGRLDIAPAVAEWDLCADLNAIIALRCSESAAVVLDWAEYHAGLHGLQAAVILNRAPDEHDRFARALAKGLADRGLDLTLVVVESPVPLGKRDTGPESHPFLAPDAPGKDRMERPAPDPWRAP